MTLTKTTAVVLALTTAATGFSGAAFAQGRGDNNDRWERRDDRRDTRRERREDRRDDRRVDRGQVRAEPRAPAPAADARWSRWQDNRQYTAPRYNYSAPRYTYTPSYSYPRYSYNYGYNAGYVQPRAQYWVGGYVPTSYRQPYYYVNDWHSYNGLYAPPYGHQWVRTDTGDFLLMALATGLIANLILSR